MTDNTRRLAGVTYATIDGVQFKIADSCDWQPGWLKRESMTGLSGWAGYSETFVPASITIKVYDAFDLSVTDCFDFTNVTVVVEAATGKTIVGSGMTVTEAMSVSGKDGSFELKFEGPTVRDN